MQQQFFSQATPYGYHQTNLPTVNICKYNYNMYVTFLGQECAKVHSQRQQNLTAQAYPNMYTSIHSYIQIHLHARLLNDTKLLCSGKSKSKIKSIKSNSFRYSYANARQFFLPLRCFLSATYSSSSSAPSPCCLHCISQL